MVCGFTVNRMSQSEGDSVGSMPSIGARIPSSLRTNVERIAHEETEPGERNVKPSHVMRAALRLYVEEYEERDLSAFQEGGL